MAIFIQRNKYISRDLHDEVFEYSKWLKFVGVTLFCLGLLCFGIVTILMPLMPKLHSASVLAGLLGATGMVYIVHAAIFWQRRWLGFSLHILAGAVYSIAGYIVYIYPLADILILAEMLMAAYLIVGIFRIIMGTTQGIINSRWNWTLLSGVINLALAYFIWSQLPDLSIELIGFIISVELVFTGWALFILGVNAKQ